MKPQIASDNTAPPEALPGYHSILLAVDSSDHSNRATQEAVALGQYWQARLAGAHVYAAKLHDHRFRQMEGGLPEQFRAEQELERQRDVHDDLITKGLSIITDSYLDQVESASRKAGLDFVRRSLEGKNYRELAEEANSGDYDLLVMGAIGLGAVEGSRLGTVCRRVARRTAIDTLIIKEPDRALSEGPIVVAVDGSSRSYGGLRTALALAQRWNAPVHVLAVFDPYYHYVAFNRIARVLSEEAGKVFRFQQQEQLHEEIIDSGLAKIYQGHLDVAQSIARDHGMEIETHLLDGKPNDAIAKYVARVKPSLLVLGKLGIHADAELDIGGNAEQLLDDVDCAVLLSQREFRPRIDLLASVTTSWTHEAEQRMERVPSFVRSMARMAILRYAQEKGHTVITESIVEEATGNLMPGHAEQAMAEIVAAHESGELKPAAFTPMRWSEEATALLMAVEDLSLRGNLSMRAEKKARADGSATVERAHIAAFLEEAKGEPAALHWNAAATARLMRVPEGFMRMRSRERIEEYARRQGLAEVSLETAEAGLAQARAAMEQEMGGGEKPAAPASKCPFAVAAPAKPAAVAVPAWQPEAAALLDRVPAGYCQDMTRKAVETMAANGQVASIDTAFVQHVLEAIKQGSDHAAETLPWDESARAGIAGAPEMVRGRLMQEIEASAKRAGLARVTQDIVDQAKGAWQQQGFFHLDPTDPRGSGLAEGAASTPLAATGLTWTAEAEAYMERVPPGFMRDLIRQRVEKFAGKAGSDTVTLDLLQAKYADWAEGSAKFGPTLSWDEAAWDTVSRIPSFVRGMVIKEVERCARDLGLSEVNAEALSRARGAWEKLGTFHSETNPDQYK